MKQTTEKERTHAKTTAQQSFPGKVSHKCHRQRRNRLNVLRGDRTDQRPNLPPLTRLGLYSPAKTEKGLSNKLAGQIPYEYFVFYDDREEPIGFSSGCLRDARTFIMEWSGILPAHQRQGLYSGFLAKLLAYLKELGVERVTSNHMGTNRPVLIAKLKAGFNVTGFTLDERWGVQVWLTTYLTDERQQGFERAFSLDSFA